MTEEEAEILNNMDVKSLEVVMYIDKETFYTNAFDLDMDMTMKIEEEEMRIVQKMKSVITKINEIDEIVVPQEVIDGAVDFEELMQQDKGKSKNIRGHEQLKLAVHGFFYDCAQSKPPPRTKRVAPRSK